MRRRDVLVGAGTIVASAPSTFPSPAIAQGIRQLTMVTDWPDGPGLLPSARRLAQTISGATGGRIKIEVSAAGAVVKPFETFDAVQAGVADMFHSYIGYFDGKARNGSPAFNFYSTVPFGFAPNELFAWVRYGGGQELWDQLSRQFNIKPLHCCSTGNQMGGWFTQELTSLQKLKGLRYRMAGLGAEVYARLGAIVVVVPGGEIVASLKSGAIDAGEWVGPWLDTAMGLHNAASYYYYPGWHEPGVAQTLGINMRVWESFSASDQRLIEACAAGEYAHSLAEFNTNNALSLRRLRDEGKVKILKFDDSILKAFYEISKDLVIQAGSGDELSRKIYASYHQFRTLITDWSDISEGAHMSARRLA